jgi:hypothetical protein
MLLVMACSQSRYEWAHMRATCAFGVRGGGENGGRRACQGLPKTYRIGRVAAATRKDTDEKPGRLHSCCEHCSEPCEAQSQVRDAEIVICAGAPESPGRLGCEDHTACAPGHAGDSANALARSGVHLQPLRALVQRAASSGKMVELQFPEPGTTACG